MSTLVLDDDPTGTQSASDVTLLLDPLSPELEEIVRANGTAYVLTNTRAIPEREAVSLLRMIRERAEKAAREAGVEVAFVLRGDSTLRGHVFAEIDVFLPEDGVVVFAPAFPAGGRVTRDAQHLIDVDGRPVPAHETEYAADPVFPFDTSDLVEYVRRKSGRSARSVGLAEIRTGSGASLVQAILSAPPGTVIVPDAETDADIELIARSLDIARRVRPGVVIRCGSPLAAALVDATSRTLLDAHALPHIAALLVVCGSHTAGAAAQLAELEREYGPALEVSVEASLTDPDEEGDRVAALAGQRLARDGIAVISTPRHRLPAHNTLAHGACVMHALTRAVTVLEPTVTGVVSKGGITSADIARHGLGATRGRVLGQLLPGVSVVELVSRSRDESMPYVVVPGNVGDPDTLAFVVHALQAPTPRDRRPAAATDRTGAS